MNEHAEKYKVKKGGVVKYFTCFIISLHHKEEPPFIDMLLFLSSRLLGYQLALGFDSKLRNSNKSISHLGRPYISQIALVHVALC